MRIKTKISAIGNRVFSQKELELYVPNRSQGGRQAEHKNHTNFLANKPGESQRMEKALPRKEKGRRAKKQLYIRVLSRCGIGLAA